MHTIQQSHPLVTEQLETSVEQPFFQEGIHRAEFMISKMSGAQRERIEELVLTRANHVRNGETISFSETDEHIVIHQRFHVLHSIQTLIAALNIAGVQMDLKIHWEDDVTNA